MKLLQLFKNKRIRLAVLFVFLLVNGVTALSYYHKSNQWRITMDSAISALASGNYEKAEERYLKVLKSAKNDFKDPKQWLGNAGLQNVYYMQGLTAHEKGDYKKGQEQLLKALAIYLDILSKFPQRSYSIPHPSPVSIEPSNILNWMFIKSSKAGQFEEAEYYLITSISLEEKRPGFQYGISLSNHEVLQRDLGQVFFEQKKVGSLEFLIEQCKKWNYTYALESLEPKLAELKKQL